MRYLGSSVNSLDAKGRVMLPSKYRRSITADGADAKGSDVELYVTLSYDNEIRVYTESDFEAYVNKLFADEVNGESRYDENDPDERRMRGLVRRYSASTTIDGTGRITIPALIREAAGITKSVVVEGSGEYLSLCDPDRKERFLSGEDVGGMLNEQVAKRKARLAARHGQGA